MIPDPNVAGASLLLLSISVGFATLLWGGDWVIREFERRRTMQHLIYRFAWALRARRIISTRRFEAVCRWLDGGER